MGIRLSCNRLERRIVPAADYILTNEHADIQVDYEAGVWSMFVRDKDLNVDYPSVSSLEYVNTTYAQNTRPAASNFDFIGVGPSQTYYRLPQLQNPNLLYHGFGAEAVAPGTFGQYDPAIESHGRESGSARWVRLQLTSFIGPGTYSVFRNGDTGPIRYISTFNDGIVNPELDGVDYTDGISADDSFWMFEGAHAHLNFAFTAIGRYEVSFTPTAIISGSFQTGPEFKFVYSVEHVGQMGFQATAYSVNEGAGTAIVTVERTGAADGAISVDYETLGGTATPDVDYTPTTGTLTFYDLETVKTFTVPITNDMAPETAETIGLTLSNFRPWNKPGGGTEDPPIQGSPTTATLTIIDNDSATPPQVSALVVNGGAAQRSRVTSVAVTFNQVVSFSGTAAAAFQLKRQLDSNNAGLTASVTNSASSTTVTLGFAGALAENGSVADGRYTLTIFAGQVMSAQGKLDGDGNGIGGDDHVLVGNPASAPKLFRIFGDADGDGTIAVSDFIQFRLAFGGSNNIFDHDNDGAVSASDFVQFRLRFGASI